MSVEESILNIITDSVINDYYTAGIKTEVVIDTLITPVITELIKEMLENSGRKNIITGDVVYITKEFPMIKQDGSYSNTKADYLIMDEKTVYLVELKTSMDSMEQSQIDNYYSYINNIEKKKENKKKYLGIMMDEFSALFNSVSNTGMGIEKFKKVKMNLPDLVKLVLDREKIEVIDGKYKNAAKEYLKGENTSSSLKNLKSKNASSSKKYLMQAVDIVKNIYLKNENENERKNLKLIYIVPREEDKKNITNDKRNKKAIICSLDKLDYTNDHSNYYEWVKNIILKPIFEGKQETDQTANTRGQNKRCVSQSPSKNSRKQPK